MMPEQSNCQTKVITGICRWDYVHVWKPRTSETGGKPKYSAVLIIPKSDTDTVSNIHEAIMAAYEEGKQRLRKGHTSIPELNEICTPLHDGDREHSGNPAYANSLYLTASAITVPTIVDASHQPVTRETQIYSGVYGRASISFYAYNFRDSRGIACCLHALMKIHDGTRLGYTSLRSAPQTDFCVLDETQ